jgi:hypothetical protein
MVFLFILDILASATLHIVTSCGYWVACKSSNGAYYLYNKLKTAKPDNNNNNNNNNNDDDAEYIIITREEYNRLRIRNGS